MQRLFLFLQLTKLKELAIINNKRLEKNMYPPTQYSVVESIFANEISESCGLWGNYGNQHPAGSHIFL
jgi:hypothetical protein